MGSINEYIKRKQEMDQELTEEIHNIVNRFYDDTGLMPSSISVDMINTSVFRNRRDEYIVGAVTTEVRL